MIRRPPRSTRTDTLFPYTTLFRNSLAEIGKVSAEMERVVETLLALARQEAGLDSPAVEPVELAGLVNAQLERLADAARKRQVTFTTRVGGEAWGLAGPESEGGR